MKNDFLFTEFSFVNGEKLLRENPILFIHLVVLSFSLLRQRKDFSILYDKFPSIRYTIWMFFAIALKKRHARLSDVEVCHRANIVNNESNSKRSLRQSIEIYIICISMCILMCECGAFGGTLWNGN